MAAAESITVIVDGGPAAVEHRSEVMNGSGPTAVTGSVASLASPPSNGTAEQSSASRPPSSPPPPDAPAPVLAATVPLSTAGGSAAATAPPSAVTVILPSAGAGAGTGPTAAAATKPGSMKPTVLADLSAYGPPGASMEERLAAAIKVLPLLVISKSWCPFCAEAINTVTRHDAPPTVVNLDVMAHGGALHAALKHTTHQNTVPYVFIGGKMVGGCSDLKALEASEDLDDMLTAAGAVRAGGGEGGAITRARDVHLPPLPPAAASAEAPRVYHALFNFPNTVDGRVIRAVALQVFAIAIAIIVLRDTAVGRWLSVALLIDFGLRFMGGAPGSPLGVIGVTAVSRMRPILSAGPPKQFAVAVGIAFSAAGTAALWADSSPTRVAGAIVWAVLAFFAALEGFLNFCAGCWVFGKAIQMGLLPPTAYAMHVNKQGEVAWQWDENMGRHDPPPPAHGATAVTRMRHSWAGSGEMATDVFASVDKDDAAKRRDWDPIKHIRFGFFNMSLTITGIAQLWRAAAAGIAVGTQYEIRAPDLVWQILVICAAVMWVVLAVLLVLKAIKYPRRMMKEFWHPADASTASFPFIILCLFAQIISSVTCGGCNTLARVLLWAGAGPMLLLAFVRVADMLATPADEDALNPSWLVAPVGLFVAATAGPRIDPAYGEVMAFYYAFAMMMWIITFVLMFSRRLRLPSVESRMHPQYYGFVAAPAIAASAYFAITSNGVPNFDFYAKVLLWISLGMYCVLTVSFARSFLGSCCFAMTEWGIGFPTIKLAATLLEYHSYLRTESSQGLAYALFILANITIVVLLGRTVTAMMRGGVWRNPNNWLPLQASLYLDEAIGQNFIHSFLKALAALHPEDVPAAARLAASWTAAEPHLYRHLLIHKNGVLFPAINEVTAGAADAFIGLNTRSGDRLARAHTAVQALLDANTVEARSKAIDGLRAATNTWLTELAAQLVRERQVLYPIAEKLIPLRVQKELLKRMWDGPAWAPLLPWLMRHLPTKDRRVRFLRALQWAMPERLHQVGMYLARTWTPSCGRI